jgi:type VI secretion system protein ImpH
MASEDRTATRTVDVMRRLEKDASRYDFFQALRTIECAYDQKPRLGESQRAGDDPVRLSQEPSLAFAPSTIAELQPTNTGIWEMSVRFFGLFGPNGPLPLHLTEYTRERERNHHDVTLSRFLDIFHHRMLSLFYRAWANTQPHVHHDRPKTDRFSTYVASLFGAGMPELRNCDDMPDLAKLYYAGHLTAQSRHPDGLRAMLSDFFQLPVQIEEFVGQWTEIPDSCRCQLGDELSGQRLGESVTIGSHVWDCQQKFRIVIGPMTWQDYERLLPGGSGLRRLVSLVRNYIGDELMWDLQLILQASQTPPAQLACCGQLGRSTWLCPESVTRDASDLILAASDALVHHEIESSANDYEDHSEYTSPADRYEQTLANDDASLLVEVGR